MMPATRRSSFGCRNLYQATKLGFSVSGRSNGTTSCIVTTWRVTASGPVLLGLQSTRPCSRNGSANCSQAWPDMPLRTEAGPIWSASAPRWRRISEV